MYSTVSTVTTTTNFLFLLFIIILERKVKINLLNLINEKSILYL